jgi:hypothetical protein
VALLVLYPIVIAALIGAAVNSGPSKPRVAVLNELESDDREIQLGGQKVDVSKEASPLFESIERVSVKDRDEAERRVKEGDVLAALIVPRGITRTLQAAAQGAAALFAVGVAFLRTTGTAALAALSAAVLIALQLVVDHWFYLYLVWFAPLVWIALLSPRPGGGSARSSPPVAAPTPG